nr:MAG TPA: hypothetical protein [Caudoviricetes sp.]
MDRDIHDIKVLNFFLPLLAGIRYPACHAGAKVEKASQTNKYLHHLIGGGSAR